MEDHQYYIEAHRERDGALVRYCRVDEDCPDRDRAWEKRIDMVRHIEECHGLDVDIPCRHVGRPKDSKKPPLPPTSRSHRQSMTVFANIDVRVRNARKKHLKDLHKAAPKKWRRSMQNGKMLYETWLAKHIENEMGEWEKNMPSRRAKMQAKINKGYDAMLRKKKKHSLSKEEKQEEEQDEVMEREGEGDSIDKDEDKEDHLHSLTPPSSRNRQAAPKAPKKSTKHGDSHMSTCMQDAKCMDGIRQPKFGKTAKANTPIDIPSPTSTESSHEKDVNVVIKNQQFYCQHPASPTMASYMARLHHGMVYHLRSSRYGLEVDCDMKLVNDIATVKASSRALNLFALWMENVLDIDVAERVWFVDSLWLSYMRGLPSDRGLRNYFGRIDISTQMFTFFPIVDGDHWTLVVFYNCHVMRVPNLPRDKSAILFFDPLSIRTMDQYLGPLKRVLHHFSSYTLHPHIKNELQNPDSHCAIRTMEMPRQPNGRDCGYYVMIVMRLLILGGLMHKRSKKWLTANWFSHKDVEMLKEELDAWIHTGLMKSAAP